MKKRIIVGDSTSKKRAKKDDSRVVTQESSKIQQGVVENLSDKDKQFLGIFFDYGDSRIYRHQFQELVELLNTYKEKPNLCHRIRDLFKEKCPADILHKKLIGLVEDGWPETINQLMGLIDLFDSYEIKYLPSDKVLKNKKTIIHSLAKQEECTTLLKQFIELFKKNNLSHVIHTPDQSGYRKQPLHYAAELGSVANVSLLIEEGVKYDSNMYSEYNGHSYPEGTILHIATREGHKELVDYLVNKYSELINIQANWDHTALHESILYNHPEVAVSLIDKNADVNCLTDRGTQISSLLLAVEYEELAIKLLENGAEISYTTKRGRVRNNAVVVGENVLHFCARDGCEKVFLYIMEKRSKEYENLISEKNLVEGGDAKQQRKTTQSYGNQLNPIFLAAFHDQIKIIKLLHEKNKLDINARGHNDKTLLMVAVENESKVVVEYLLGIKGIGVNLQDNNGNTALHYAKTDTIIELLLQNEKLKVVQNNYGTYPSNNNYPSDRIPMNSESIEKLIAMEIDADQTIPKFSEDFFCWSRTLDIFYQYQDGDNNEKVFKIDGDKVHIDLTTALKQHTTHFEFIPRRDEYKLSPHVSCGAISIITRVDFNYQQHCVYLGPGDEGKLTCGGVSRSGGDKFDDGVYNRSLTSGSEAKDLLGLLNSQKENTEEGNSTNFICNYYHSEQALFHYLSKQETCKKIASKLPSPTSGGNTYIVVGFVLDIHNYNYPCYNCKRATVGVQNSQKQTAGFIKRMSTALSDRDFSSKSNDLFMTTRISSEKPYGDMINGKKLSDHSREIQTIVASSGEFKKPCSNNVVLLRDDSILSPSSSSVPQSPSERFTIFTSGK